jgi:hypothetical protein
VADPKNKRLYDAIENGVTDLSDLMLKDRITELKAIRDHARADTERAEGAVERLGPTITTQSIKTFARTARKRMRTESGGYRRDYLRALAQRVEVDAQELRIMGSKSELLPTLVAASSAKTGGFWRAQLCTEVARSERFELPTLGFEVHYAVNDFNGLGRRCCSGVANSDLGYRARPRLSVRTKELRRSYLSA